MKKILYIFLIVPLIHFKCFRLDSFAYPASSITSYELDNYTGDLQFTVPSTYDIDPSLVTIFTIQSENGSGTPRQIYAIYIGDPAKISIDRVILYCHGFNEHMDYYWPRTKLLANLGPAKNTYGVLMFDYQGYGLSEGTPSEENLFRDTDAAMVWLKSQGLTDDRLIIYGYSMGTVPATNLTANMRTMQPSLIILESPMASLDIIVQDGTGLALPSSYLLNSNWNNADAIKQVTEPFLWLHGIDDDFVNIGNGEIVYANYGGTVSQAVRVAGAGHSDVPYIMGFDTYISTVHNFISTSLP